MHAVILCPGPSLASLHELPACDLSIGVNRAPIRFVVDVWAAMDYPLIRKNRDKVLGNPELFTHRQTWLDIQSRVTPFPSVHLREEMGNPFPDIHWGLYTFTSAMVYAHERGADEIDIYGADFSGTQDYDGEEAGENRRESRWTKERWIFEALADAMQGVRRMNVSQL